MYKTFTKVIITYNQYNRLFFKIFLYLVLELISIYKLLILKQNIAYQ